MSPLRTGWTVALLILLLDQATKQFLLSVYGLADKGRVMVTPWFDLVLVWNRGISYGLLQQDSDFGRWALVAVSVVAVIGCGIWLAREPSRLTASALGLLIGGAIGNGIDRAVYGAVVDFVSLHYGGFYWYVFNVADVAIVAAVVLLVYDSLRPRRNLDAKTD